MGRRRLVEMLRHQHRRQERRMAFIWSHLSAIVAIVLVVYIFEVRFSVAKYDWTKCIGKCSCKTVGGEKQANCSERGLTSVPIELSEEIQVLNLEHNDLGVLEGGVFRDAGLINLQKLSLHHCSIEKVDGNAFDNLSLVIRIDLSHNEICQLNPSIFSQTVKLRCIKLNSNRVKRIEDGLFRNLEYLQTIELNDNEIAFVARNAFSNLQALTNVNLKDNKLVHLDAALFEMLPIKTYLEIGSNPWRCDCHLREFFIRLRNVSSETSSVHCKQPQNMENRTWDAINADDFACPPRITWPETTHILSASQGNELTLSCRVTGDPKPQMYWIFNANATLLNRNHTLIDLSSGEQKYAYRESTNTTFWWYNVTIKNLSGQDKGIYTCVATNAVGTAVQKVSVQFGRSTSNGVNDLMPPLHSIIIGIVCGLMFIFLPCFVACRRGYIKTMMDLKNLLNNNAITLNRNTNIKPHIVVEDNTGIGGDSTDYDRSTTNSLKQMSVHSQDNLSLQDCTPNLLASFNHCARTSPFSVVSHDAESSPATAHFRHHRSPVRIRTRISDEMSSAWPYPPPYGLPPSLGIPSTPPIISHQRGYATIPRQMRFSSWSNTSPAAFDNTLGIPVLHLQPLSDDLGLRTTASGNSMESLPRRIAAECLVAGTGRTQAALYSSCYTLPHKRKLGGGGGGGGTLQYSQMTNNVAPTAPVAMHVQQFLVPETTMQNDGFRRAMPSRQPSVRKLPMMPTTENTKPVTQNADSGEAMLFNAKPPKPPRKPIKNGRLLLNDEDRTETRDASTEVDTLPFHGRSWV